MSVDQALHHFLHSSLAGHVQGRGGLTARGAGPRRAVDVRTGLDEEAGGGRVVEEDGSVEERQGGAVWAPVPGVGVTAVDDLRGKRWEEFLTSLGEQ